MENNPWLFDAGTVRLGGPVGQAAADVAGRLLTPPFTSLPWLRADLTGETLSEFDDTWDHPWNRPFKNFSGDISGRFLEAMSLAAPQNRPAELLDQLIQEILKAQHPDGSFCSSGELDWSQPIDFGPGLFKAKMMPALWGNSRLLCGLVEAARAGDRPALMTAARRLGDFYQSILPRLTDPNRVTEYVGGDTFAAGYVICYYPAIEGLVKLYQLCGDEKHLDTAKQMAAFYTRFDTIPIDHSHGMLCGQVGLLLLHEVTGDSDYLRRVESRWDALIAGEYINPAGGILEKCRPVFFRDEGCALVDWLRLNLDLARITGKHRYWAMAERVLHNHLLQNQGANGGFGHRKMIRGQHRSAGFDASHEEAKWCCTFHGLTGLQLLTRHLCQSRADQIQLPLPLPFEVSLEGQRVRSNIVESAAPGELFRQQISVDHPTRIAVRLPDWALVEPASDPHTAAPAVIRRDGWVSTAQPVRQVTWVYRGEVRYEALPVRPDEKANLRAAYLGPWLLGQVDHEQPAPLSADTRGRSVTFCIQP